MPRDWKVQTGAIFGENTYGVQLEAPNQEAGVLLIAMKVEEGKVENSVHLASMLLDGIKKQIPSLKVGEIASNKESTRTCATVTYDDGGKSYRGTFYFFLAQQAGTFLGYGAEVTKFDALRPMLVNIVSNLAYSPNGIDATETKARQAATESDAMVGKDTDGPQHQTGTPLARLAAAKKQQVDTPLQVTRAQNGSMTMLMPRGWTLQNDNGKYFAFSDQQGTHGISMSWSSIWLPDRSGLGMDQTAAAVGQKVAPAMAPAQALCWLLEAHRIGTQTRILGVNTGAELGQAAQEAQRAAMRNNSQSAVQVVEIEFTLNATGKRTRGIFYVQCTYPNMGNIWSIFTAGHWAPAERYEQLLPMFVKMSESYAMDQNWAVARNGQQTADLQASQQKMFQSINDLGKQYERNNASWRENQRSQDYLSAMRSQTTLGQGTWIAQHEGGESVNTYSWGAEDHQGNQAVGQPWNTTNFKGQSPFTGQQLEEVNSRQVWERYQGMR